MPGRARSVLTARLAPWRLDHNDRVAVERRHPVSFAGAVADDRVERRLVVELEADVVGDAAAEIRDPPEEPVRGAVGGVEARRRVARRGANCGDVPLGPLLVEPALRLRERDEQRAVRPARLAPEIRRLSRRAETSARVSNPSRAVGRIAAQTRANQMTPRTACTAPTKVTASTRSSNALSRRLHRLVATSAPATSTSTQKSAVVPLGSDHCHSRRISAKGASTSIRS